jgi:hypothetical protein
MRYLDVDSPHIERAEALFERLIGYSLVNRDYNEIGTVTQGAYALKQYPFSTLLDVKARSANWGYDGIFGKTEWTSIHTQSIFTSTRKNVTTLHLPPTIFGTNHTEVDVTYSAGIIDVQQDVKDAILKIADLIELNEITEWNTNVPDDVAVVIDRYRREVA